MELAVRNYFLPLFHDKMGRINKKTDLFGSILLFILCSPDGDRTREA
jgi:hypothetical protein